jgi:hypothetical protein
MLSGNIDFVHLVAPAEDNRILVHGFDSLDDACDEFLLTFDANIAQEVAGYLAEEHPDQVEPGPVFGRKHKLEAFRSAEQIALGFLGDMRRVVVQQNQADFPILWVAFVEELEKLDKLPAAVTLLSPFEWEKSSVSGLPEKLRKDIWKLDEFSLKSFPLRHMSFTTIGNFKGFENGTVIVIDVPPFSPGASDLATRYVGMSRARSLLSMIYRNDLASLPAAGLQ